MFTCALNQLKAISEDAIQEQQGSAPTDEGYVQSDDSDKPNGLKEDDTKKKNELREKLAK